MSRPSWTSAKPYVRNHLEIGLIMAGGGLGAPRALARYKVPREIVFVDALPRNATGKVLKRELR